MKYIRILILVLVLCLCLPFSQASAQAISGTSEDGLSWSLEDGVLTVSGNGAMGDYTFINPPWHPYSGSIVQVVIGPGVASVGACAFMNYPNLRQIIVGPDVVRVEDAAFRFCSGLEEIIFQGDAPAMSPSVFVGVTATAHYFGDNSTWTEDYFSGFSDNITWLPIDQEPEDPDAITGQMGNIRWSLSKDSVLTLSGEGGMPYYENSDGSLSYDWYEYTDQITKVVVEEGITQVGTLAFADFPKLQTVELAESVTVVGLEAFRGTPFLQSLLDEQGLAIYDGMLIAYCGSGTEVTVPAHVGGLTYGIFANAPELNAIYVEEGNTEFASLDGALYSKGLTELLAVPGGWTGEYTLPQDVRYIASFAGSTLTRLIFTGDAPRFGSQAFYKNALVCLYPAGNDTWTEEVRDVYAGDCAWLPYERTSQGMTVYGTWGTNLSWSLDGTGHLKVWGSGAMENYYVPSKTDTLAPEPPDWMFFGLQIQSAVIEPGITSICNRAFWQCPNLKTVSIPETVTRIGSSAFLNCTALEEIILPDAVSVIDDYAFQGCTSLKRAKLPAALTTLGYYGFSGCTALEEIVLPDCLETLGSFAFEDCTSLVRVTLPKDLREIPTGVFRNTPYWDSLKQGDFLIAGDILVDYTGPGGAVVVPEGVRVIDRNAFSDRGNLTSVELPEGLLEIRDGAFQYTGLTSVSLPKSLESVGDSAFGDCSRLTDVTLGNENTRFSADSFENTPFLEALTDAQGFRILGTSLLGYVGGETELTVPNGVKYIARWAFSGNTKLTAAVLPEGVLELGSGAFQNCSALKSIDLPQSLQYLGDSAFRGCKSLVEISIPKGVTGIGTRCFLDCKSLRSVSLPEGLITIGYEAFCYCAALAEIRIPGTVTTIEYGAFQYCSALTGLDMPDSVTEVGGSAFGDCHALASVRLSSNLTQISARCFNFCTSLRSVTIPDSVTSIGEYAFFGCSAMEEITFGTGLRHIRKQAFVKCAGLDRLVFTGDAPKMDYPDLQGQVTTFNGVSATAVYPAGNPTWTEDALQGFGGSLTWETSGCKEHNWQEATCEAPRTCSVCGETEGDALGHKWADAACEKAKTCTVCGKTDGKALGHKWADATCEKPKTCSACGKTEGKALGHKWADATCEKAKTCSACGKTEGKALGHKWADAACEKAKTCTVCGKTDGMALGHKWTDATCEKPKTCTVCGKTEDKALGHKWTDATCESPKTCSTCGKTEGDVLDHDFQDGKCTMCGTEDPDAIVWGDATGEGIVDYMDAMMVLRHAVKLITLSEEAQLRCNVDGKGGIDYMDAMLILRHAVKLIDKFPIEK